MQSSRILPFFGVVGLVAAGACGGGSKMGVMSPGLGGAGGAGAAPGVACADPAPWTKDGTPDVTLEVNADGPSTTWSRFYEGAVATDHANTILSSRYGRNAAAALKKGHDEAGFRYARFHGILNRDINLYPATAPALATDTPAYDWTRFDMVYDAIMAAGMRPIVEISFTPPALASTTTLLTSLWYGGVSPNISKPIMPPTAGATPTWDHWKKFMADIVTHLESRYGADEVRNNWYFEVWNEATWMYEPGGNAYNELYLNTAQGLLAGDPMIKVGGPADTGGDSQYSIPSLINFAKQQNIKLDFISYHRYGEDSDGHVVGNAGDFVNWKNSLFNIINATGYTGELINDEWGSGYDPELSRDTEASASFIAKSIHFLGTDTTTQVPTMYGYWTLSDIYEEINTGAGRAYREGNYGLLLKGDNAIPVSYDLAKPAFNAFRLLHLMTDKTLTVTGGVTDANADGVNAVATLAADGNSLQILVYNHVNHFDSSMAEAMSQTSQLVSLTVDNLPFTPTRVLHYVVDHTHSNSHTVWAAMGKPVAPSADQWQTLSDASELCYYANNWNGGKSMTAMFPQYTYSASLIELRKD